MCPRHLNNIPITVIDFIALYISHREPVLIQEVSSKFLSNTDSTVRLAIPTSALPHFENSGERDLLVRDWTEQEWKFRFSTRNVGHAKPFFTGDWVRFAKAKRLQLDDSFIFTQLEDGQYRVEVFRETDFELLGQKVMWIHVDKASAN
ncbi:hypothetical protein Patl1_29253 [Pistacia atlantica]|uniref:Uncharacterized protein n=1 Tax=Pistacia atlantica TaxID=434234 RepID=A0ACC1BE29_9ROSI|nr:hypothetical protein Patl1_29253 [Pistacia atlantica]